MAGGPLLSLLGAFLAGMAGLALATAALLLALTPPLDRLRRHALRGIVIRTAGVLDAHHVDYWCDFGTLLGLHRERDIILGDKDADFCVLEGEMPKLLALGQALAARGLSVAEVPGKGGLVRIRDAATPFYVDVYPYLRDGSGTLRSRVLPGADDVPEALVGPRVPVPFLESSLRAPADIPALLRHRYGPAFMVPRRNDKGATRPYSRLRSLAEDVEHSAIAAWGLLRRAVRG